LEGIFSGGVSGQGDWQGSQILSKEGCAEVSGRRQEEEPSAIMA